MPHRLGQPLHHLRLERRALRAERDRVGWWRRVVRARMDLAVASALPPGTLGEHVAFALPVEVGVDVPRPAELRDALPPAAAGHEVGLLPELRALDARLARYEEGVEQALARTTSRLVELVAVDPAVVLRPVADGS